MSADYWLEGLPDPLDCPACAEAFESQRDRDFSVRRAAALADHEWNFTYNLIPMLRAAGWYQDHTELVGDRAGEHAARVQAVADTLAVDPARFKTMNPPNGWGSYEDALAVMQSMALGFTRHPDVEIGAWL